MRERGIEHSEGGRNAHVILILKQTKMSFLSLGTTKT